MSSNSKLVTVVISVAIKPGKMEIAKQALIAVIKTVIEQEKDCQGIEVYNDTKNPQCLLIIEKWTSEEVFLGPHMQTPHMVAFMKIAGTFVDGEAEFTFWNEILSMA